VIASPFLCAATANIFAIGLDTLTRTELFRFEVQLARLDLREIQDVVQDREQGVGRAFGGRDFLTLLGAERRLQH
jgi:hypothetical protein